MTTMYLYSVVNHLISRVFSEICLGLTYAITHAAGCVRMLQAVAYAHSFLSHKLFHIVCEAQ